MPAHRKHAGRAPHSRDAIPDDQVVRTRYGRGAKSATEKIDPVSPKTSPTQSNGHLVPRKATRSFSNNSSFSNPEAASPEPTVFAKFDAPILIIHGLSSQFLERLEENEKRTQRKERMWSGHFTHSDLENETSSGDNDVPTPPVRGALRGARARGGRGGRARGRGRGRGGRGRGTTKVSRDESPARARKTRNIASTHAVTEDGDGEADPTNQESLFESAKDLPRPDAAEDAAMTDASEDEEDGHAAVAAHLAEIAGTGSTSPPGSTSQEPGLNLREEVTKAFLPIPKIALPPKSTSRTPREGGSTAAPTPTPVPPPRLVNPEDDVLSDSDLPGPWIEDHVVPKEVDCEDRADYLLQMRYKPLTDMQDIIAALTKYPASQRSTETLYLLAANTQEILKAWQDEYLVLDAKTAPHAHPPKKPANGGRVPDQPLVFEDKKEADLYGYVYDHKKLPGTQDPFAQRVGAEKSGGRELRQRRARDMLDSAAQSEEDEEEGIEGRGVGKRQRRATRRFDGGDQTNGDTTPKKSGWGGARKKGVSKYTQPTSETPEPEGRPAKRQKVAGNALLHQRIQAMREESAVTSSGDEGSSANSQDASDAQYSDFRKRGRPAGSKNTGRRSDYGVKKGPRRKGQELPVAPPSEPTPSVPPQVLQSLSEGQNQFSVDPRPPTPQQTAPGYAGSPPSMPPQPVATVFQATPQPLAMPEPGVYTAPIQTSTPEAYMSTTPLSQYGLPYMDDSATSGSGSRRKPRVKSEKRSQSMTQWWAERKARQKELEGKVGDRPVANGNAEGSKPSSRKGSRASSIARSELLPSYSEPANEPQPQAFLQPLPPPPMGYTYSYAQSMSVPSPGYTYGSSAPPLPLPPPPPPPHHSYMQHLPTTAPPTGPFQGPPIAQTESSSSMPPLAPAPMPPQLKSYPSPYGPRTAPRPRKTGPPLLAPAPAHVSPYPPAAGLGPTMQRELVDMPFKVLVPGPPPAAEADMR